MKIQVRNELIKINNLTITEQLIFLIESLSQIRKLRLSEESKNQAIIGAMVADLFSMNKVGLVNNKVVVTNTEKTQFGFLNRFIDDLQSQDKRKFIIDIIHCYQYKGESIQQDILDTLVEEDLLLETRGLIPFVGSKEFQVRDRDIISKINERIQVSLTNDSSLEKESIYLLAILQAIGVLKRFFYTSVDFNEKKKKRLQELMKEEYLAKMIYEAIKQQPESDSLAMVEMPPLHFSAGLKGIY